MVLGVAAGGRSLSEKHSHLGEAANMMGFLKRKERARERKKERKREREGFIHQQHTDRV